MNERTFKNLKKNMKSQLKTWSEKAGDPIKNQRKTWNRKKKMTKENGSVQPLAPRAFARLYMALGACKSNSRIAAHNCVQLPVWEANAVKTIEIGPTTFLAL